MKLAFQRQLLLLYPMLVNAAGPSLSHSCARYKLAGVTCVPSNSKMPLGKMLELPGAALLSSVPMQPMHQLITPGGAWTSKCGDDTFQATAQPASHPCPEPSWPRLEYAMPSVLSLPPGNWLWSASRPVAQRW